MKRVFCVVLALAALLSMAAKCESKPGPNKPAAPQAPAPGHGRPNPAGPSAPDPHAGDPQPSGQKDRVITITVRIGTKEQLPGEYYVSTVGSGVNPKIIGPEPIADTHRISTSLVFDAKAPDTLRISVTLKIAKTGTGTFCSIQAGAYGNDGPRFAGQFGDKVVMCFLTINRPR